MSRFKIRRLPISDPSPVPWALKDHTRPARLGQYPTLAHAVAAMDAVARADLGAPRLSLPLPSIREAMRTKESRS